MNAFLFVNPASGRYTRQRVGDVVIRLRDSGLAPTVFTATTPSDALPCCHVINECRDRPLVIVAAGDGTFNAVVNGLLPGTATLAVLPLGTSNVLAHELGIGSVGEGLKRIAAGATRQLSVGVLELEHASHRFVLLAGIGLDGAVVRDVKPHEKRILKQGAFALSALRNAWSWDRETFTVCAGGKRLSCHSMVACNASRYGGDFILAADGDVFSPGFAVNCITGTERRTYLRIALDLFSGRTGAGHGIIRIAASEVEILGGKPIQIDGDFVGYGPARLTALADFARIIV